MDCPYLTDAGSSLCMATQGLYSPSDFEQEEYCRSRRKMCPYYCMRTAVDLVAASGEGKQGIR